MSWFTKHACGAVVTALACFPAAQAAYAADLSEPAPMVGEAISNFDIAFGVKLASEYNLRSVSQTSGDPAIQGYAELSAFDWVYAGFWGSNVNFGGSDPSAELDYYGGLRHSWGGLTLDGGYLYIDYVGADKGFRSLDFWKIYGIAKYAFSDDLSIGANVYWTSDFINTGIDSTHASLFGKYSLPSFDAAPNLKFYISAEIGRFWAEKKFVPDYTFWNAGGGVSYKAMTLDLRYTDSQLSRSECATFIGQRNSCGARFMASLSFDTSLSKLK
ncbi:TorF family putative porin [Hansschlegelia sp. KR7-227]|jgi:uncharacterized protein (TIGR02001 family)|uniref:TorF family putative porin n=1 Tax=Hansschlegelia sp. KR7-227 TaxID=3400914 RepID=UPI003C06D1A2